MATGTIKAYVTASDINYVNLPDFDQFIPTGTVTRKLYGNSTRGSADNAPITGDNITWRAEAIGTTNYFTQEALVEYATTASNRGRKFIRQCLDGTFTAWKEIREQTMMLSIPSNETKTFTMSLYGQCTLTFIGYRTASMGTALIVRNANNAIVTKWLGDAPSNIAISIATDGTGKVTITNNDGTSAVNVWCERNQGSIGW